MDAVSDLAECTHIEKLEAECTKLRAELVLSNRAQVSYATDANKLSDALSAKEAECARLREALGYPRHGNTAGLLREAAKNIDNLVGEGYASYLSPHLRRAAERIDAALAAQSNGEKL